MSKERKITEEMLIKKKIESENAMVALDALYREINEEKITKAKDKYIEYIVSLCKFEECLLAEVNAFHDRINTNRLFHELGEAKSLAMDVLNIRHLAFQVLLNPYLFATFCHNHPIIQKTVQKNPSLQLALHQIKAPDTTDDHRWLWIYEALDILNTAKSQ